MQDDQPPVNDAELEAYLDGMLDEVQRAEMERRLRTDENCRAELGLQSFIDGALRRVFPVVSQCDNHVADAKTLPDPTCVRRGNRRVLRRILGWATAASILIACSVWILGDVSHPQPFFEPTPLTTVYRDSVRNGFQPYYKCEDDERFAQVFSQQLLQPLRLRPMPAGSRMLGLSYPGGISRNTVAMLCSIDQNPVMVFVDRAIDDVPQSCQVNDADELNVFREVRSGLVYYEVTPFDRPRAMEYLDELTAEAQ